MATDFDVTSWLRGCWRLRTPSAPPTGTKISRATGTRHPRWDQSRRLVRLSTSWLRTASSAQGVVFEMNFDSLLDDILLDQLGQVSHDGDTLVGT